MTRRTRWLAIVMAPLFLVGCARIISKLRGERDSGSFEAIEDKDPDAAPWTARGDGGSIRDLLGFGPAVETDAGCPRDIHPGYCRRRCRGLTERQGFGHARRVYPSEAYAFGTCGGYQVFAERTPDAGGIVEYFDPDGGQLVGATDDRVKPCGRFGSIPSCTPKLVWRDAGFGQRSILKAVPSLSPDDEE
jgi:hypothetical protein